jgi:hypothetical protein
LRLEILDLECVAVVSHILLKWGAAMLSAQINKAMANLEVGLWRAKRTAAKWRASRVIASIRLCLLMPRRAPAINFALRFS